MAAQYAMCVGCGEVVSIDAFPTHVCPVIDSGGFEVVSPVDEINEHLGYDADVSDRSQYCSTCGEFVGSWWGPDYICRCG